MHRKPYSVDEAVALGAIAIALIAILLTTAAPLINDLWHFLTPKDTDEGIARSSAVSAVTAAVSLIAASIAAVVAFLSFRQNQDAARRELRAYMAAKATTLNLIQYPANSGNIDAIEFVTEWENVGLTPARKIISGTSRAIIGTDLPDNFDYSRARFGGFFSEAGPGAPLLTPIKVAVADLKNPKYGGRLFVWAYVEYSDVFKGSQRHRTEVCHEFLFDGDPASLGTRITARHRGRFNGSDDDCFYPATPLKELFRTAI